MLPDFERKLLRILYNFSLKYRRIPDMRDIQRLTGRHHPEEIEKGLFRLEEEKYIVWEDRKDVGTIRILEGWDRTQPGVPRDSSEGGNTEYWTKY
ncbi:hypothetical protein EJP77_18225 [Paenibacillus zeisoli]|uniref:Uncharacterized protein n=1 Tax=Paenibacillus zeisoli TaxID=2496267 RepID=A0A3S1B662_9BACL|nr:hypothetical protein [Paenibacillus zeisoli]RUT28149.1 hypothetical protein EJP77_18225 [Paenibacillus zeisoli]